MSKVNTQYYLDIYERFLQELIRIGKENINNGLILDDPEEQLMDSLVEFNDDFASFIQEEEEE